MALLRMPDSASHGRHMAFRVLHVPNVHVTPHGLAHFLAIPIVDLKLGASGGTHEVLSVGAPAQAHHGVSIRGRYGAEGLQVSIHALEVVYAHRVVVRAREQARARPINGERGDGLGVPRQRGLIADGYSVLVQDGPRCAALLVFVVVFIVGLSAFSLIRLPTSLATGP
eukprot:scaffold4409_cov369-Prasinococcus_capsulatus_cf.AAC.25